MMQIINKEVAEEQVGGGLTCLGSCALRCFFFGPEASLFGALWYFV